VLATAQESLGNRRPFFILFWEWTLTMVPPAGIQPGALAPLSRLPPEVHALLDPYSPAAPPLPPKDSFWRGVESKGWKVQTYAKSFGKERKVDSAIAYHMGKDAVKLDKATSEITLVAGDKDHVPAVEDLVKEGFTVCVAFWDHAAQEVKSFKIFLLPEPVARPPQVLTDIHSQNLRRQMVTITLPALPSCSHSPPFFFASGGTGWHSPGVERGVAPLGVRRLFLCSQDTLTVTTGASRLTL
jgi:hypothetical protein